MNSKALGFTGAGLLIVGLFLPAASMPIVGNITMMSAGLNWVAFALVALAALSVLMVVRERYDDLIWTGGAALLSLLYMIGRLQYGISEMRANLLTDLKDNPFAGMAQTAMAAVGLQWGWLVLLAGSGLLIYVAAQARKERGVGVFAITDPGERIVVTVSVLVLLVTPVRDAWSSFGPNGGGPKADNAVAAASSDAQHDTSGTAGAKVASASAEEAAYAQGSLKLYDLEAKYYDTYEGKEPGVDFKVQNLGNRTLDSVKVIVVFYDAQDKPIAEETYYPVNVGGISFSGNDGPLRPNYIWKQERGQFYTAKSVPDEWKVGRVTAKVAEIKFSPTT